jgi:4-hydroxybenzoate polyprenyltransferase
VGRRELAEMSVVLMSISLVVGALLSWYHVLLLALIYFLSFIYSFPPVRFKEKILSPLLLGLGAFIAFIYGFMTPLSPVRLFQGDADLVYPDSWSPVVPWPSTQAVLLGTYMFIGLVVGSMVTDIEGYEEDVRAKVHTVYTRWGLDRGRRAVSFLVLLTSLTPLALFHTVPDIVIFPLLGAIAAYLFLRYGRSRHVLALALLGMTYAAWRFLSAWS